MRFSYSFSAFLRQKHVRAKEECPIPGTATRSQIFPFCTDPAVAGLPFCPQSKKKTEADYLKKSEKAGQSRQTEAMRKFCAICLSRVRPDCGRILLSLFSETGEYLSFRQSICVDSGLRKSSDLRGFFACTEYNVIKLRRDKNRIPCS